MAVFITSLNSGSNGNCYYVGNEQEAVLVDAGISRKETEKRMYLLGLSMQKIKAIFISHEHSDHIRGLAGLADKYDLPVYISSHTAAHCGVPFRKELAREINALQPIQIGELTITAFPKYHDAVDPHSFIISCNHITVGVFTDIGSPCDHLIKHFSQCHAAFLEANYDEDMLENGRYPRFLKNRIRGGMGHLSNRQALEVFTRHRPSFMTHLLLSHLSRDNNDPVALSQLFNNHAGGIQIVVASRDVQTAIYTIERPAADRPIIQSRPLQTLRPLQLRLF